MRALASHLSHGAAPKLAELWGVAIYGSLSFGAMHNNATAEGLRAIQDAACKRGVALGTRVGELPVVSAGRGGADSTSHSRCTLLSYELLTRSWSVCTHDEISARWRNHGKCAHEQAKHFDPSCVYLAHPCTALVYLIAYWYAHISLSECTLRCIVYDYVA